MRRCLALIGQIPEADIGRGIGHLHEIRDQAGIIARLVDFSARIRSPAEAIARLVAQAIAAMRAGGADPRRSNARSTCGDVRAPARRRAPRGDGAEDRRRRRSARAAKRLGAAKSPMIMCGGGAQDASPEVTALAAMLQAPVLGYRRGRGVLDSRDPLSVTLPLGRDLWGEADVVLGIGTRLFYPFTQWGIDRRPRHHPHRLRSGGARAASSAGGGADRRAAPILRRLLDALPAYNAKRASRRDEMRERHVRWDARLAKLAPQRAFLEAIRAALPEDGILTDEVTQIGFAARLAFPVYRPRTFLSPGYQDNLGWGFATALGAQHACPDVPVVAISGDGGFMFSANELATAVRHRIPLVAIVFNDGAFGNVRRIQAEQYGNRLIACDLANPDFVRFAESFGAAADRAKDPAALSRP